jgi:hypothetical protein
LDVLLTSIYTECLLCDISVLHELVVTREIEDIESINVKQLCETIWTALMRCWSLKAFSDKEKMVWETACWLLSLPTITATEEDLRQIGNTITKEFCTKCKMKLEFIVYTHVLLSSLSTKLVMSVLCCPVLC